MPTFSQSIKLLKFHGLKRLDLFLIIKIVLTQMESIIKTGNMEFGKYYRIGGGGVVKLYLKFHISIN